MPDDPDDPLAAGLDAERTGELLAQLRDGDPGAFEDLYRRYHDELLFAVRAHLGPRLRTRLESEDILQSVVVDAFHALPRLEPRGPGGLRHYLHAMVVNKIRGRANQFDAAKRAGDVPLTPSRAENLTTGEPTYHEPEKYERLERALAALPDEMRRVLVLRKIDGLTSREAAEVLGKSDDATRKLYSRALARLSIGMGADTGE